MEQISIRLIYHSNAMISQLVKILQNYRVKLNLLEGSEKIISGNSNLNFHYYIIYNYFSFIGEMQKWNLTKNKIKTIKQGISIDDLQNCLICDKSLIDRNLKILRNLILFRCNHSFHDVCLSTRVNILIKKIKILKNN